LVAKIVKSIKNEPFIVKKEEVQSLLDAIQSASLFIINALEGQLDV
jgi:hypothetical protein